MSFDERSFSLAVPTLIVREEAAKCLGKHRFKVSFLENEVAQGLRSGFGDDRMEATVRVSQAANSESEVLIRCGWSSEDRATPERSRRVLDDLVEQLVSGATTRYAREQKQAHYEHLSAQNLEAVPVRAKSSLDRLCVACNRSPGRFDVRCPKCAALLPIKSDAAQIAELHGWANAESGHRLIESALLARQSGRSSWADSAAGVTGAVVGVVVSSAVEAGKELGSALDSPADRRMQRNVERGVRNSQR